jgi:hypothetical protein
MKTFACFCCAFLLLLPACRMANKQMHPIEMTEEILTITPDEAAIVFYRVVDDGVNAPIVEAAGEELRFVATVSGRSRALHRTKPGKHVYIVGGEGARMLDADLAPGKYHYVHVKTGMGLFKPDFTLIATEPLDLSETQWLAPNLADGNAWILDNANSWKRKLAYARSLKHQTLDPSQGVDALK